MRRAYTVAFEQDDEDRAEYGARLLGKLAEALRRFGRRLPNWKPKRR